MRFRDSSFYFSSLWRSESNSTKTAKALSKVDIDVTILTTNSNGTSGELPLDVPLGELLGVDLRIGEHGSLLDSVHNLPYRNDGIYDQNREVTVGAFISKPLTL